MASALASCGGNSETASVTVFAAVSLTDAFTEIGEEFASESGKDVTFNFAGSQELRTQLEHGADAEVFASADSAQMDLANASGVIGGEPEEFARNRLVAIVPAANAAGIEMLEDLAAPGLRIVIAGADVPAGKYTRAFLEKASTAGFGDMYADAVLGNVVSEENSVRQVVAKVQLDEADAGFVYSTDVTQELLADVHVIEIPGDLNVIASYPIARTADDDDGSGAAFIEFVLSEQGQAILEQHGFERVR
jgi:molybdate transport system substrate-binding protein